jgi:hypothetical protein
MQVRIEMGRRKPDSRIFIDGVEITRGVLDFDVQIARDLNSRTAVVLTIWPEKLELEGELGAVIAKDLIAAATPSLASDIEPARDGQHPICVCFREGQMDSRGGMLFPLHERRLNPEVECPIHAAR